MDEIDTANAINEQHTADALRDHWRKQPIGQGLKYCEECGEEIPTARRKALPTARMCIDCQTEFEQLSRREK